MEKWRTIENYEGYEISNLGRVKSFRKNKNGYILHGGVDSRGYDTVCLYRDTIRKTFKMHTLVWDYFGNSSRKDLHVDHYDNNKLNNNINNLQVLTAKENTRKYYKLTNDYPGISWHIRENKWQLRVTINNKRRHIGLYEDKKDAIKKYLEYYVIEKN